MTPQKNNTKSKVLVLDANQRSGLAVIRSLGKIKNIDVYAADKVEKAIGGSSKYSKHYYQYPSIEKHPTEFIKWLIKLLANNSFDILFPCTETASQLLLLNKQLLGKTLLPFAPYEMVMSLAHKGNLMKLAKSLDVKIPNSTFFKKASDVNIPSYKDFPLVIKPCLSQIWRGNKWEHTVVKIVHSTEELSNVLEATTWLQNDEFMLQQFIPGYGAGLFALYNKGESTAFFAHKRLREKPPEGGVSVLSKSIELPKSLLENTKKILDKASWHGVAMVEFRVSDDGTPYLMEVNTRFWGSLQLAIDSGVDFPNLLYRITKKEKIGCTNQYKKNAHLRWFLGDLDSLYLTLRSPKYSKKDKLICIIIFLTPHFFTTRHQVGRWGDMKPALTELKQYIKDLKR